jgi:hypothetical protein
LGDDLLLFVKDNDADLMLFEYQLTELCLEQGIVNVFGDCQIEAAFRFGLCQYQPIVQQLPNGYMQFAQG